jgi:hypothetical protein
MAEPIEGIKLIYHNSANINLPDDPSFPWRLDANFRPPEFMQFAFIGIHGGSEEIAVLGKTRDALEQFVKLNDLNTHPRLRSLTITERK